MGCKIRSNDVVLITGGGGYLGSKLAERLIDRKCRIYLADIKFNRLSSFLVTSYQNAHKELLDLKDESAVSDFCARVRPNFIFHFGGLLDRGRDFLSYTNLYDVNVKGTLNLLEGLKESPYSGFYFASTSEVYGVWKGRPFREDNVLAPLSPYSLTKMYGEELLRLFSELHKKPYTILRIFNFFGPGMPNSTFFGQMFDAYKNRRCFEMTKGAQARDILFIDDLLDQMYLILESNSKFPIFNLCSGASLSMIEIVEELRRITKGEFTYDPKLAYRNYEVWETIGDASRMRSIGFSRNDVQLADLLRKCIDFNEDYLDV